MPQSFTCLNHHIIFSTKHREPHLHKPLAARVYDYIGGIVRETKSVLLAAGGMPDHVHLLVSLSKEMAVADALRLIKTNSSKRVHETFPDLKDFAWQTGYGAFAVSYSNVDAVKSYIAGQEEHHRVRTFQEEYRAFLDRHGIKYDERYLWD
jgi:putative transposase